MFRIISVVLFAIAVGLLLAQVPPDVHGCAAVGKKEDRIRIAEESAIIIWDSAKKVEHFIRRASFDTPAADFGFLVPTPSVPDFKKVEDGIFRGMEQWLLPRTVIQEQINYTPFLAFLLPQSKMDRAAKGDDKKDSVRILGEHEVSGFQVKVLEADSSEALSSWLKEHGYAWNPELASWLAPYVAQKWKLSAFKIMQDPKTGVVAKTSPVRMTFATERPFFPYREPAETKPAKEDKEKHDKYFHDSRLLRVFFVSDTRMDGQLGNETPWHARVRFADQLTGEQRKTLITETGVAESDISAQAWLTTFEDSSSPRPGKDEVYFVPAKDRSVIRPPDHVIVKDSVWIPVDVVGALAVLVLLVGMVIIVKRMRG